MYIANGTLKDFNSELQGIYSDYQNNVLIGVWVSRPFGNIFLKTTITSIRHC
jgi:hypothetical protein